MDIVFNTGRLYTANGQIVRALWDQENEVVHFADFSRGCNGSIDAPTWEISFKTPGGLAKWVMERYDRGLHKNTPESWELLMRKRLDPAFAQVHEFQL